ncbi:hypothetical protein Vadar_020171 [Vaccinium darrowii]|uniref:Uncharacterized protein n=1 Tax=Vaccinium darrowii TaxID=229202 RepID=A0ACB7X2N7_9ERIC|nr:hypothetical protein Vadar_020171 [Vaccinium darrowii]
MITSQVPAVSVHQIMSAGVGLKILPLTDLHDASKGFLVNDTLFVEAEVSAVSAVKNLSKAAYGCCGEKEEALGREDVRLLAESLDNDSLTIIVVLMASSGESRKVILYPKGCSRKKDKFLSIFLQLGDSDTFPYERKTYAKYKLRIVNQKNSNHVEVSGFGWGCSKILSLTDLHDASKGFLVNDSLLIEAEVSTLSAVKNLSSEY